MWAEIDTKNGCHCHRFDQFVLGSLWQGLEPWGGEAVDCSKHDEFFCGTWKVKILKEIQVKEAWFVKFQREAKTIRVIKMIT